MKKVNALSRFFKTTNCQYNSHQETNPYQVHFLNKFRRTVDRLSRLKKKEDLDVQTSNLRDQIRLAAKEATSIANQISDHEVNYPMTKKFNKWINEQDVEKKSWTIRTHLVSVSQIKNIQSAVDYQFDAMVKLVSPMEIAKKSDDNFV